MLVQDVMVKEVVCVDMDARLPEVKTILQNRGFHHLPVLDKGKLVGIISDRDILRLVSPFIGKVSEQARDLDTLNRAAHQVMTRQPITVKASAEVKDVVNWMLNVNISCVPVIDDEDVVVGIVTWRDLINHATF